MTIATKGYIALEIGPPGNMQKFILDGSVGDRIQVGFRAKDGDKELPLGSLADIIGSVVKALGVDDNFKTTLDKLLEGLKAIPPLAKAVNKLLTAPIFITDLAITAEYVDAEGGGSYKVTEAAFGFRVEFSDVTLGPIELAGFGVLFEYTVSTEKQLGDGRLSTRALPA